MQAFVTFTEEISMGKLNFLCSGSFFQEQLKTQTFTFSQLFIINTCSELDLMSDFGRNRKTLQQSKNCISVVILKLPPRILILAKVIKFRLIYLHFTCTSGFIHLFWKGHIQQVIYYLFNQPSIKNQFRNQISVESAIFMEGLLKFISRKSITTTAFFVKLHLSLVIYFGIQISAMSPLL